MYLVSPGYNITLNATEYEFDVDVHSPIGSVVFEALLIVENMIDNSVTRVANNRDNYGPYSVNFISTRSRILIVTVDEDLDPNDDTMDYYFNIGYELGTTTVLVIYKGSANVIFHEIGKL